MQQQHLTEDIYGQDGDTQPAKSIVNQVGVPVRR
jgi:hypothetical protein